jgi:hypothetical protein
MTYTERTITAFPINLIGANNGRIMPMTPAKGKYLSLQIFSFVIWVETQQIEEGKSISRVSGDNEVGRSATSSLAGWVSAGVPGADAQGPGDAGTTDESPTQPVHGETTKWQQPGGCCRSGGHLSAQCPPD